MSARRSFRVLAILVLPLALLSVFAPFSPLSSGEGSGGQAVHTTSPAPGEVLYFLVVAQNTCGLGTAGNNSSGGARTVVDCL